MSDDQRFPPQEQDYPGTTGAMTPRPAIASLSEDDDARHTAKLVEREGRRRVQ